MSHYSNSEDIEAVKEIESEECVERFVDSVDETKDEQQEDLTIVIKQAIDVIKNSCIKIEEAIVIFQKEQKQILQEILEVNKEINIKIRLFIEANGLETKLKKQNKGMSPFATQRSPGGILGGVPMDRKRYDNFGDDY